MDPEAGAAPSPPAERPLGRLEQLAAQTLGADDFDGLGDDAAELVRRHQLEIFAQSFPKLLLVFTLVYTLLSLATLALLVWLIVSYIQEWSNPCDVPLKTWAAVDLGSTVYHAVHSMVLQYFCYDDRHNSRPLPLCERVHLFLVTAFDFIWLGLGLVWLSTSKTCSETSPRLFLAAKVHAISSVVGSVFICINMIGLYTLLRYMLQTGVLRTNAAAPPGTLESLPLVQYDPQSALFQEQNECCICLAAFGPNCVEIRQTDCQHIFHSRCLGNWLKVNHTCPLCRSSLARWEDHPATQAAATPASGPGPQQYGSGAATVGQPHDEGTVAC